MAEATVYWRDSWNGAKDEAKKANRPLVLEFYMESCPHCLKLHQQTHADQEVAKTLNTRFIPVRLEGRAHMDLVKEFNVTGAPTTLILSPDGKELHRFSGFYPPAEYLKEIEEYG
ncbi:MAG: thioredoxin family protein [Deltaproteobacteria bacterium]|nr:thioredoxin family protein [Deltaproteobacteria bacterium]